MRYGAHDTICSTIHLPFLAGKQRLVIQACDHKHRTPPTATACAVMMSNGYNNGGLLRVSRYSVFVMNLLVLLEYTGCYLRYLMLVSNFGMCYNYTVSYIIFLRAYRDMYRSPCISGTPVCWCIVSALKIAVLESMMIMFKDKRAPHQNKYFTFPDWLTWAFYKFSQDRLTCWKIK